MPKHSNILEKIEEKTNKILSYTEDLQTELNSYNSDCPTDSEEVESSISMIRLKMEEINSYLDFIQEEYGDGSDIKKETLINMLTKEYLGDSVDFNGTDEINPFYGRIDGFKLDTNDDILVTLIDQEDNAFDVDWNIVRECRIN